MERLLSLRTQEWIEIIGIAIIVALFFIFYWKKRDQLIKHKRKIDNFPTIISTLGVLGTFYGITKGLWHFDTIHLNDSIPKLLEGLKTAFWTSLAGMLGSMILSFIINKLYDDNDDGVSDINLAATLITKTIQNNAENQTAFYNTVGYILESLNSIVKKLDNSVSIIENQNRSVSTNLSCIAKDVEKIANSSNSSLTKLNELIGETSNIAPSLASNINATNKGLESIDKNVTDLIKRFDISIAISDDYSRNVITNLNNISNDVQTITSSSNSSLTKFNELISETAKIAPSLTTSINDSNKRLDAINGNLAEISTTANSSLVKQGEILSSLSGIPTELRNDITSVENKMTETNSLLAYKFDEFSELLKKSNTETLVEVMKRVTEEFEKQMGDLIGRLVKENFDQLNTSVERLNIWQQENKEMISALIAQYKQMTINFSATDQTLQNVGAETANLVSQEGKLQQIVTALNEVMVKDEKFKEIIKNLSSTADLTKANTQQFKSFTDDLTVWLNKQKEFKSEIDKLIKKIDEINKINDYSDTFWQKTKKGFDDGIKIISDNNTKLFEQFKEHLDQQHKQLDESAKQFQDDVSKITKQIQKQNDDSAKTFHSMLTDTKEHLNKIIVEIQKGMGTSVASITKGSEELNKQITALDQHFYNCLGTTLGQLDECISQMLSHYSNRR